MALQKLITARAGFDLEYWRIGDWRPYPSQNMFDITLVPYVSSTTRTNGLDPVNEEIRKIRVVDRINKTDATLSITNYTDWFSPTALETAGVDIYKIMYDYIKTKVPEFEGALDV